MSNTYRTFMLDDLNQRRDHASEVGDHNLAWEYGMLLLRLERDVSLQELLNDLENDIEELNRLPSYDNGDLLRAKREAAEYISTFLIRTLDAQ